jgi:demethoxyubiquinone hydroxylase (CLK1/Coq7/Cat5 family)
MRIPNTTRTWIEYFEANEKNLLLVPRHLPETIRDRERSAIARSIRIFQLGENSDGKTLIGLTRYFALRWQDAELEQAMSKFIKEEQRHAALLGSFMDQVKIPRATGHWSDSVFRQLRRLWNLEISLAVLLTAELIARVYYHALYRATSSQILRQICRQLLRDEVFHVYFHTHLLRKIRHQRPPGFNSIWNALYRLFHAGTLLIVWTGHSAVLQKGGFSFLQYWRVSRHYCEQAITLLQTERLRSDVPRRNLCGIRPS